MSALGHQLFRTAIALNRAARRNLTQLPEPLCICAGFRRNDQCPKCGKPESNDMRPGNGVHVNTENAGE